MKPSSRRNVLPALQEALEIERRYRFDLTPQAPERRAMNTRQDTPVAPFDLTGSLAKMPAKHLSLRFQRDQRDLDCIRRKSKLSGETSSGHRSCRFHPAAHDRIHV